MVDFVKPVGMDGRIVKEMYVAAIRRYYRSHKVPIFFPIDRKEFGVGDFGRKISRRYLTFSTSGELRGFLLRETPPYISYSVADWEHPDSRDDRERGFLGAELVFEFDDDEFVRYSPNDISYCPNCKDVRTVGELTEQGLNPLYCVHCGDRREIIPLPSASRWNRVVQETKRLIAVLVEDFGIPEKTIYLNYSGNRGIHTHVTDHRFTDSKRVFEGYRDKYRVMQEMHRIRQEFTNYLTLSDFDASNTDLRYEDGRVLGPTPSYGGMVGRVVDRIRQVLLSTNSPYVFHKYLSSDSERKELENLLRSIGNRNVARRIEMGLYDSGVGNRTLLNAWRNVFKGVAKDVAHPIDAQTSSDIKRLIRLPNTIHGTTGLVAKTIRRGDLDKFDPYKDAVALPRTPKITLWIRYLPEIRFDGRTYGPYTEEEVDIPLNLGFFLLGVFGYWAQTNGGGGQDVS